MEAAVSEGPPGTAVLGVSSLRWLQLELDYIEVREIRFRQGRNPEVSTFETGQMGFREFQRLPGFAGARKARRPAPASALFSRFRDFYRKSKLEGAESEGPASNAAVGASKLRRIPAEFDFFEFTQVLRG